MPSGITFSEVMEGGFALDQTDPEIGHDKGNAVGTKLTMHADVSIPDLEAFIANPEHPGELEGSIDFEPLGTGVKAHAGVFNLFRPSNDPDLKLMVYRNGTGGRR